MHGAQCGLVGAVGVLQRDEHREHDEQAVLRQPGLWLLAEHQVLERWNRKRGQAGVDALGISLEHRAIGRRHQRRRALRLRPEAVQADRHIGDKGPSTNEGRQFARRAAAAEIHLEEALLGVKESGRPRDIHAGCPADRRDAERIPGHSNSRRQSRHRVCAVEQRQAALELPARPDTERHRRQHDQRCCRNQDPQPPRHGEILVGSWWVGSWELGVGSWKLGVLLGRGKVDGDECGHGTAYRPGSTISPAHDDRITRGCVVNMPPPW